MTPNRHDIDGRTFVEEPLLQLLEGLGWQVLRLKSPAEGHSLVQFQSGTIKGTVISNNIETVP